jgi:ABC-2 type transport system permease protein
MRWRPVAGVVLRQYYLLRTSVVRVIPLVAWVVIDILLWGFLTRYLNSLGRQGVDFVPQFLGAVLLWDFLARVMLGVSVAFLEDVWSRNFLNFFSTPLSVAEYVTGLVIVGIATSLLGLAAMVGLAVSAFGLSFLSLGLFLAHALFVLLAFGVVLGIVACAVVLRWGPAAEWLTWPIPALLAPFAGVFYPVSTLPGWMQSIAAALPPSYVFEALRARLAGGAPAPGTLLRAELLTLAYLLVAGALFQRVFRAVVRSGLLARYTAETGAA